MGYVLTEILPWILASLAVGLLLGLFYWWCRWWLSRNREEALRETQALLDARRSEVDTLNARVSASTSEVEALTGRLSDRERELERVQARVSELEGVESEALDLRSQVSGFADLSSEADGLRARVGELESENAELPVFRARIAELEADLGRRSEPARAETFAAAGVPDVELDLRAGAETMGFRFSLDDLKVVEGIGPKISQLLRDEGIDTWRKLSQADTTRLSEILHEAGPRYQMHDPGTWPRQAGLLAEGRWEEFRQLTDHLSGGRE